MDEKTRANIVRHLLNQGSLVSGNISAACNSVDFDVNHVQYLAGRLDGLLLAIDVVNYIAREDEANE